MFKKTPSFFCNFYFLFLQIALQLFKLNIYLIKSSKNTHIWLQFVADILLWNFRQGSWLKSIKNTKYNRNTHTHTHTHTHTTHTTRRQTYKTEKSPSYKSCLKKHICHINIFLHLKVYLSFVE